MDIIRFAILGLASGAIYALLAQGLVLIYRGSGLLNFAQGAIAMVGAYIYYELTVKSSFPPVVALVITLPLCAVLGAALHLAILRPMRQSSPLARVIATLGILLVLQSLAYLVFGHDPLQVPSVLPTQTITLFSDELVVGVDRLLIFAIAAVLTVALSFAYRYTAFGRVTTAVAENEIAASSLGYSPDRIAAANWALGSMLAGLAGVLIAPIIFLEPTTLVMLVIPAMSAALIGGFTAFGVTFCVAVIVGVAQSEIQRYVDQPGWATAVPFIVVLLVLVVRGRALPLRGFVLDRLPKVGTGRVRVLVVLPLWVAGVWLALSADADWSYAIVSTFGAAIICLSIVVLTGYTGQLSLAQYVLAGVGVLIAAKLATEMPFILALLIATGATACVGGLLGLPALRTRGVTLAVVTLGLGGALADVVLGNTGYTGGVSGIMVPSPSIFGWSLDPFLDPANYAVFAVTAFVIVGVMVANLRRGVTGRRMLAVRSNERAAASLGVNVAGVKSYAFVFAAGLAALGGIVLAFIQPSIQVSNFDLFSGILVVAVVVAAGVGYVPGALLGALMISGGIVSEALHKWPQVNDYLPLVGGVVLVLTLMFSPDGLFEANRSAVAKLWARGAPGLTRRVAPLVARVPWLGRGGSGIETASSDSDRLPHRVEPRELVVENVSVSFGGVHALKNVSLDVAPGEVHGLIGPNGAGKTTLIDAITGFVGASAGTVNMGSTDMMAWSPRKRARAGLSRSFQSLELFTDLTIGENLAVAVEQSGIHQFITDLIRPGSVNLTPAAQEALAQFELQDLTGVRPTEVSFGQRKTVAIARAIAGSPSILLLDEPAAGLDDHEAAELATLIRHLADAWGIGILLVEHKVDMIMAISDRVTVLQQGQILASGTPNEVRADKAVVDAYLGDSAEPHASGPNEPIGSLSLS